MVAPAIFSFGLIAFGFLGMGPVTIAVDSYGPVTDNAQSVYELSAIETLPNIKQDVKKEFGFEPDFENAKVYLEENDGRGTPSRRRQAGAHRDGPSSARPPHLFDHPAAVGEVRTTGPAGIYEGLSIMNRSSFWA